MSWFERIIAYFSPPSSSGADESAPASRSARPAAGKSGAQGANQRAGAQKKASGGGGGRKPASPPPAKPASSATITRLDEIDYQNGLARDTGDRPLLTKPEVKQDYAVLYTDKHRKSVTILASLDTKADKRLDPTYVSIRQQCTENGLSVNRRVFTQRHVIGELYEKLSESDKKGARKDQSKVRRQFFRLVEQAMVRNVSDVHIEVRRDTAVVRYREQGDLVHVSDMGVEAATDIAKVVYNVLADEKDVTFNPRTMQDAVIDADIHSTRVRIRLATTPAAPDGFDMVLRILATTSARPKELKELGYTSEQVRQISLANAQPVGIIVMAGVTGSGKSTSLVSMLAQKIHEADKKIKVITVENPVETIVDGATQVSVVESRDGKDGESPFARAIKAAMRLDPDVIMVGEIRDPASASLSVDATQSGHQALGTLHAASIFAVPPRLRSLSVENEVMGSGDFFSALIWQSLVQLTCKHCCTGFAQWKEKELSYSEEMLVKRLQAVYTDEEIEQNLIFRNPDGCSKCTNGISGREVVAEVLVPNNEIRQLFAEARDIEAKRRFLQTGGETALQVGVEKVRRGVVDPRDLEKKLGLIDGVLELCELAGKSPQEMGYVGRTGANKQEESR